MLKECNLFAIAKIVAKIVANMSGQEVWRYYGSMAMLQKIEVETNEATGEVLKHIHKV